MLFIVKLIIEIPELFVFNQLTSGDKTKVYRVKSIPCKEYIV